jgi:hypothetical protein
MAPNCDRSGSGDRFAPRGRSDRLAVTRDDIDEIALIAASGTGVVLNPQAISR